MMVEKSLREAYGDEIIEIGRKNPDIWVVDADVGLFSLRECAEDNLSGSIATVAP